MRIMYYNCKKENIMIQPILIIFFGVLIARLIYFMSITSYGTEKGLLLVLGVLLTFPIILSLYRCKRIDVFEPVYTFLVSY